MSERANALAQQFAEESASFNRAVQAIPESAWRARDPNTG